MNLFVAMIFSFSLAHATDFDQNHSLWNEILQTHVSAVEGSTRFNYSDLKANSTKLDTYLKTISQVSPATFKTFSEAEKLAFYFNAYNAFTVRLILDQSPLPKSIRDIKKRSFANPTGNPWKIKFFDFLGEQSHLDRIEHDLTRPHFDEPRLHMAFNCASIGCPALLKEAFMATKLEEQLDQAARAFLADTSRNRYKDGTLYLSKIFDWYGKDFEKSKKFGSLRKFVVNHMKLGDDAKAAVLNGRAKIVFLDYDWNLNSTK